MQKSITLVHMASPCSRIIDIPPGCSYLISSLRNAGIEVDYRDYQLLENVDPCKEDTLLKFLEGSSKVIGFSTMHNYLPLCISTTRMLKQIYPDKTIILGGAGPATVAQLILDNFPWIDAICVGSGTNILPMVVASLYETGKIPMLQGMHIQRRLQNVANRCQISNYEWDGIPQYEDFFKFRPYRANLVTYRGCSFACVFCDAAKSQGHDIVVRPIPKVLDELRSLADLGVKKVNIADSFLLTRRPETFVLLEKALNLVPEIDGYYCNLRFDQINRNILERLASLQVKKVLFGYESPAPNVQKHIGKHVDASWARTMVDLATKLFDVTTLSFTWGYPFEHMEDFFSLFDEITTLFDCASPGKLNFQMHFLSPLPQTLLCIQYRDSIRLSRELRSDIVSTYGICPNGAIHWFDLSQTSFELVKQYPSIFSGFYHLPTPSLENKIKFIESSFGEMPHPGWTSSYDSNRLNPRW